MDALKKAQHWRLCSCPECLFASAVRMMDTARQGRPRGKQEAVMQCTRYLPYLVIVLFLGICVYIY